MDNLEPIETQRHQLAVARRIERGCLAGTAPERD